MEEFFHFESHDAFCEKVPLSIIAEEFGTPLYVYSKNAISQKCEDFKLAFSKYQTTFCYAVKANGNLFILKEIFSHGFGAEVVSIGELGRALTAGLSPDKIIFSGVGKRPDEIERALKIGIMAFNVESIFELNSIIKIAEKLGKEKIPILLRINPNIDALTNEKIETGLYSTKFGIPEESLGEAIKIISDKSEILLLEGISCHIGSEICDLKPFREAALKLLSIVENLLSQGIKIKFVNMGGGLGVTYLDEKVPSFSSYASTLIDTFSQTGLKLIVEPGRCLLANGGVLITKVLGIKKTPVKKFIIVDAGMNDLIRPALYKAYHGIEPVKKKQPATRERIEPVDIVGPLCESTDFLAKHRIMPYIVDENDYLFVRGGGAYSFSMASHYNSRPLPAEVMVDGNTFFIIRPREKLDSLWKAESDLLLK